MDRIQMFQRKDKLGAWVTIKDYDDVAHFILKTIELEGAITLTDLLNCKQQRDVKARRKLDALLFLHVKQDLEVRGKISVERLPNRVQIIDIYRRGRRRLPTWVSISNARTLRSQEVVT